MKQKLQEILILKQLKSVAATGVDRISVGSITHSAPAIDFKLEI
jgi:nicotinate-nucleotide pyrophosphorylase (carboxylating)